MEISSTVLRRTPPVSGCRPLRDSVSAGTPSAPSTVAFVRTTRASARGFSAAFSDAGHLKYYSQPVRCGGGRSKEEKKRAKLLKRLTKDLVALRLVGDGADAAEGFAGYVKRKKVTKAGELLIAEPNRLRAREREIKKKKKEDKKVVKKASKIKGCAAMDSSSSSSSSSSSESSEEECGNKALRLSNLRTTPALQELDPETPQIALITPKAEEVADQRIAPCKNAAAATERSSSNICFSSFSGTTSAVEMPMNKIEVCLGGKCRKSGATELMEEFSKNVGQRGAVVGCKCMGKCRDGPNVRISADAGAPKNRLCIGVGLEDVGTIVANFFGEKNAGPPIPA